MVTHIFYFMLCQSSLLSAVISFVYKDKWWFDESMSVKPGLHISRKDRKHGLENMFFKLSSYGLVSMW